MAMNSEDGIMRMLQEGEKPKVEETLFYEGEYLNIKGCIFSIQEITPEKMVLKPEPRKNFRTKF